MGFCTHKVRVTIDPDNNKGLEISFNFIVSQAS